jgi:hypothetical protein
MWSPQPAVSGVKSSVNQRGSGFELMEEVSHGATPKVACADVNIDKLEQVHPIELDEKVEAYPD